MKKQQITDNKTISTRAKHISDVILDFTNVHGDKYDYSKVEYKNNKIKVCIICTDHGEFRQTPNSHLSGFGCPVCGNINRAQKSKIFSKSRRPDLSHIETPPGSKAVPLTQGKYALVDEEDYEKVMEYNWYCNKGGYAASNSIGFMHRFITNCPDNKEVDHADRNKLNNRKSNLRICTRAENSRNKRIRSKSKYKGVILTPSGKWRASVTINGSIHRLGLFHTDIEAARAYDEAAKKYHGEFANLNFLKKYTEDEK